MRKFFITTLFFAMFLGIGMPVYAQAESFHGCNCKYSPEGKTSTREVISPFDEPPYTQERCDTLCSEMVKNNGGTLVSATLKTVIETGGDPPKTDLLVPILSVPIPGLTFTNPVATGERISINFIGEYLVGVYNWLIGVAAVFAVLMIVIGSIQYLISGGKQEMVKKATDRIKNALIGFVLLLASFVILQTANPALTFFNALDLKTIPGIDASLADQEGPNVGESESGDGGGGTTTGASGGSADDEKCYLARAEALERGCTLDSKYQSPTGSPYNCGYHFTETPKSTGVAVNYDSRNMIALDFPAAWNSPLYAADDGVVKFTQGGTGNRCGNQITVVTNSGAKVSICHAKNFVGENSRTVKKGEIIGHVGGNCCSGSVIPTTGTYATANVKGTCNKSGTSCTDPFKQEECSCQPLEQSGNTTGPHAHTSVTIGRSKVDQLACLE